LALYANDKKFSLRKVAFRIGVEPSYLSKVERVEQPPPSEKKIILLAQDLNLDTDELLALAHKVPSDVQKVICKSPKINHLIRLIDSMPNPEKFLETEIKRYQKILDL